MYSFSSLLCKVSFTIIVKHCALWKNNFINVQLFFFTLQRFIHSKCPYNAPCLCLHCLSSAKKYCMHSLVRFFTYGPKIFGLLYFWARDVLARDVLAKDFWANDIWAKYVWTKFTIKVTFGPNMFAPIFPEIQRKSIWPKRLWSKPPFHTKFGPNVFEPNISGTNVSGPNVFIPNISGPKKQWPKSLCPKFETAVWSSSSVFKPKWHPD